MLVGDVCHHTTDYTCNAILYDRVKCAVGFSGVVHDVYNPSVWMRNHLAILSELLLKPFGIYKPKQCLGPGCT
eukprot:scaffold119079_cov15-Prasinocladus_malaysianus.AAC.1